MSKDLVHPAPLVEASDLPRSTSAVARIDVLIPVYNCAATVEAAIASIQHQTVRDIRIVVVDDGSTDGTLGIVQRIADVDPRVVVASKANGGIVDALNAGLRAVFRDLSRPTRRRRPGVPGSARDAAGLSDRPPPNASRWARGRG